MTDFRSNAERFVTEFLDYVHQYDILDSYNKQKNIMERSPGMETLIRQAKSVFPERKRETAGAEMAALDEGVRDAAIKVASNVIDTREQFSRKIAANGGVRQLLHRIVSNEDYDDAVDAMVEAREFLAAERGEKEFYVPPKT